MDSTLQESAQKDTRIVLVPPSPESMDERTSESEYAHSSASPSPRNSTPEPLHENQEQAAVVPKPGPSSISATLVAVASASSTVAGSSAKSPPLGSSFSPTPPTSSTACYSAMSHPAMPSAVMLSPYTADPKTCESITLSSYMKLMTLQKSQPQQMGSYPLLQQPMQGPQLALPTTLPPQYNASHKTVNAPHPAMQQGSLMSGFLPAIRAAKTETPGQNFSVPNLMGTDQRQQHQQQLNQAMFPIVSNSLSPQKHLNMQQSFNMRAQMQATQQVQDIHGPAVASPPMLQLPNVQMQRSDTCLATGRANTMISANLNGRIQKKRKRSLSQSGQRPGDGMDLGPDQDGYPCLVRDTVFPLPEDGNIKDSLLAGNSQSQQLKWQAHMLDMWHNVCDGALQDISQIDFHVETDKGFNFSVVDDSFVCQKKNHFQVTVQMKFHRIPKFVKMKDGSAIQPIEKFSLHLYGVKFEQIDSRISLEQSLPDRSKIGFEPVPIEVPTKPDDFIRSTLCRLHFCETTANNMRKRGKPNPEQKHFSLVVALHADTMRGSFPVVAHVSERIIVRASNPGNFDNDCDYSWFRASNEVIYHHGRVGINTDKPDEALAVNGSIQLTGQILQVSDRRVKKEIRMMDSKQQLENVSRLQLYEYQFEEGVNGDLLEGHAGQRRVGVLAQEVREIIPDATKETDSSVTLSNGRVVSRLLMVDKDRVLMEAVGAVQELKRITEKLQSRLALLEQGETVQTHPAFENHRVSHSKHKKNSWFLVVIFSLCLTLFIISLLSLPILHGGIGSLNGHATESHSVSTTQSYFLGQILNYWLQQ